MDFKTMLGGGAIVAGITAFWGTFKNIIARIYNLFIFEAALNHTSYYTIISYLLTNKKYKKYQKDLNKA